MEKSLIDNLKDMYEYSEKYLFVLNDLNILRENDSERVNIQSLDNKVLESLGFNIASYQNFEELYMDVLNEYLDSIRIKLASIYAFPMQEDKQVDEWVERTKNQLLKDFILIYSMGIVVDFILPDNL